MSAQHSYVYDDYANLASNWAVDLEAALNWWSTWLQEFDKAFETTGNLYDWRDHFQSQDFWFDEVPPEVPLQLAVGQTAETQQSSLKARLNSGMKALSWAAETSDDLRRFVNVWEGVDENADDDSVVHSNLGRLSCGVRDSSMVDTALGVLSLREAVGWLESRCRFQGVLTEYDPEGDPSLVELAATFGVLAGTIHQFTNEAPELGRWLYVPVSQSQVKLVLGFRQLARDLGQFEINRICDVAGDDTASEFVIEAVGDVLRIATILDSIEDPAIPPERILDYRRRLHQEVQSKVRSVEAALYPAVGGPVEVAQPDDHHRNRDIRPSEPHDDNSPGNSQRLALSAKATQAFTVLQFAAACVDRTSPDLDQKNEAKAIKKRLQKVWERDRLNKPTVLKVGIRDAEYFALDDLFELADTAGETINRASVTAQLLERGSRDSRD